MRCYRKILHISYKDHVTNEEVRAKIQLAIGPHEDLLTIVKRCKLQWYSHVSVSYTHLIQRPCYQRGSPCQDPADKWTIWRSPDDRKEMQTAVVWLCFPFIRFGQNHLARHSERGEENKADKGRGGKTTSGNGQAWSSPSPRGQWRTGKMEKIRCEITCGAPMTLTVKG